MKASRNQKPLQSYHFAWLSVHPERTEEWLLRMLSDGFHVHHIDGDHLNDDPLNLVLIEGGDHMMLHNGVARLLWKPQTKELSARKPKPPASSRKSLKQLRQEIAIANQQ